MTKYVSLPAGPLQLVDDMTDAPHPTEPTMTTSHAVRILFRDPRIMEALTAPDVYDLRSRLMFAKPGEVVQLSKEEHAALVPVLERPRAFGTAFLFSPDGNAFIRSILNASEKAPA